jgi:hypothetical protein
MEDSGSDEPTPAMMLIVYVQGTMSIAGASHQEVPNLIVHLSADFYPALR